MEFNRQNARLLRYGLVTELFHIVRIWSGVQTSLSSVSVIKLVSDVFWKIEEFSLRAYPFDDRLTLVPFVKANVKCLSLQIHDEHGVLTRTTMRFATLDDQVALDQLNRRNHRVCSGEQLPLAAREQFIQRLLHLRNFKHISKSFVATGWIPASPICQMER